jgi:hypothetical protein
VTTDTLEEGAGASHSALRPVVVVRPGEHPAFRLRLHDHTTPRQLEIGVLDAVALLPGSRVAIAVEAAPERPS